MNRRRFLAYSALAAATGRAAAAMDAAAQPLVSFGLITDVQYADAPPEGERHYRESIPKLRAATADLANQTLALTLHLGDLIDRDFASFAQILPLFKDLGRPVYHLLGNHDLSVPNADKPRVAPAMGMPADYYTFRTSGVRFIMLDTNDVSTYKHPAGSPQQQAAEAALRKLAAAGGGNAQVWNGGVGADQLAWLDKELTAAAAAKEPVMVCGHHPLWPVDAHQVWNYQEVLQILDRHRHVAAYLCGHNHAGAEATHNGLPCLTFKSLLHQPDVTAYATLRWFPDRLVIDGRGREKSRVVPLRGA